MSDKLAFWPFKPSDVASDLESQAARSRAAGNAWAHHGQQGAARNIRDGQRLLRFGRSTLNAAGSAAEGLGAAAGAALRPAGNVLLRGASAAGDALAASPGAAKLLGGATLAAPILLSGAGDKHRRVTGDILRMREDPERMVEERDVMASLDSFLEKKANSDARQPLTWRDAGVGTGVSALSGLGKGVGMGIGEALMHGLGKAFSGVGAMLFDNPKKKAILEKVLKEDQVLSDALKRNPAVGEHLLDAYKTLNRFAPSLALDANAVRSFLREVVLGGGQVNYATIKNLIETEKALMGSGPMRR